MALLAIITIVLGIVLVRLDDRMEESGGPEILGFEFAGDEESAAKIVEDWGEEGRDAARAALWLEYPYLLGYGAFLALACLATRDVAVERGWRRTAAFGVAAALIAAAGAAFDAIEDAFLLVVLGGNGGDLVPALAAGSAAIKFTLLAVAVAYLVTGLALRLRDRIAMA
jgi:hypothetical protein